MLMLQNLRQDRNWSFCPAWSPSTQQAPMQEGGSQVVLEAFAINSCSEAGPIQDCMLGTDSRMLISLMQGWEVLPPRDG